MVDVVGSSCVLCQQPIVSLFDGVFCPDCGGPYHHSCFGSPRKRAPGCCNYCGGDKWVVAAQKEKQVASAGGPTKKCPFCQTSNPLSNGRCQCGYEFDQTVPVSAVCPSCGSTDYRRTRPARFVAFINDRICKSCKTRYSPPAPRRVAIFYLVLGANLLAGSLISLIARLLSGDPLFFVALVITGGIGLLGALFLVFGLRSLFS